MVLTAWELDFPKGKEFKIYCLRYKIEVRCTRDMRMVLVWCSLITLECASFLHASAGATYEVVGLCTSLGISTLELAHVS